MKKLTAVLLALALAASLGLTAFAAEPETAEAPASTGPVRVWGKVTPWEGEGLFLKNGDADDPLNEVVVHLGDAPVADASTGLPLAADAIKEGDTLYAWIGPAMTMSLPPQVNAIAAVGNVAADAAVPEYYEVTSYAHTDPDNTNLVNVSTTNGTLTLPKDVEIAPWLTRQVVTLNDLVPGACVLVWKNAEGTSEKVVLFAYGYQGFLCVTAMPRGGILASVNGTFDGERDKDVPQFQCRSVNGVIMAPVRAIAEAAGYDVRWDRTLGAVISQNGETVLSVRPDTVTIQTPEGDADIAAPCILDKGVTYLPADDLAMWLNVYYCKG